MIWLITIAQLLYTVIYGCFCKLVWSDVKLCQYGLIFVIINLIATLFVNFIFHCAIKLEMYELIAGYDKTKTYEKTTLDNYLKKLAFRMSLVLLIFSILSITAPFLSKLSMDEMIATIYANVTFIAFFLTIVVTAKKNSLEK